jgi:hypothetical protein
MFFRVFPLLPLLSCLLFAADPVVHRTPVASSVFPQSAPRGLRFSAELLGEHLDAASAVVFPSRAATATITSVSPTRLTLDIETAPGASFGHHVLHVVSPRGASNPVLLRISPLPHILEAEPNSLLEDAQPVSLPASLLGRLNVDRDFDFFRFRAAKDSRWIFDLHSARNGNSLDAALILLDASGRKLAHCEERFIWDPFLEFQFPADGDYIAVIQPTHRLNDPNFAYTLDIRQAPQIDTVAPLALPPGRHQISLYGAGFHDAAARLEFSPPSITGKLIAAAGPSARAEIDVPPNVTGPVTVTVLSHNTRSNAARFLVDPLPVATGPELKAPAQVTAMARYRDPHRFTINAQAGESLTFEVRSQRFGADSDLSLRLYDASGKVVASNDDFAFAGATFYTKDPRLAHKFAAAGTYTLEVRNTVNVAAEGTPFQLTVTPPSPSFTPQLADERPYLYPGQTKKWKLTVQRLDGHRDAIPVAIDGLPAGVSAAPAIIPEGKNEVEIDLTAAADAKPGSSAVITVKAGAQAAWRNVRISSGGGEGATFHRVESALLAIAAKPNFSLEAAASAVNVPPGGTGKVPVMIRREPGFQAPIQFQAENLPPGVTLEPFTAPPDAAQVELTLRAAPDAKPFRAPRVAVLGLAAGELQEAPRIAVLVD